MRALVNKHYSGHRSAGAQKKRATKEHVVEKRSGEKIWSAGFRFQSAGGRWRRQHKTELDGDK